MKPLLLALTLVAPAAHAATAPAPRPSATPRPVAAPAAAPQRAGATPAQPAARQAVAPAPARPPAPAPGTYDNRPVSMEQFKQFLQIYKGTVDRLDRVQNELNQVKASTPPPGPTASKGEEAIDLSAPSSTASATPAKESTVGNFLQNGLGIPQFKVYFDLDLVYRPGIEDLSFDNYHSFLFFDIMPLPNLTFSFDISTSPKFYELDYSPAKWVTLRAGKIWIPWDDTSPHMIYGGRVNISRLSNSGVTFLPDLWSDLGVGVKFTPVDNKWVQWVWDFYVVNGFQSGGTDPLLGPGNPYPNFAQPPTGPDNNRDKMLGTRMHLTLFNKLGMGVSFAHDRWNDESVSNFPQPYLPINMLGADGQFRWGGFEARGGWAGMWVTLPGDSFTRGGWYGEVGMSWGAERKWKTMVRGGQIQLDSRVLQNTDQSIVGASVLWKPNVIELSAEYSHDLDYTSAKANHDYAALRTVMSF